jgi:hypothetical protein
MIFDDSDNGESEPVSPCFAMRDNVDLKPLSVERAIEIEIQKGGETV